MTADDFRRVALSLPEATEGAHMGHADFRVRGKIFATLWPDGGDKGVIMMRPAEQAEWMVAAPDTFEPVPGGWGRRGSTQVRLATVDESTLREALLAAWRRIAPKRLVAESSLTAG